MWRARITLEYHPARPRAAPRPRPRPRPRRTALVMVRHCSFLCTAMSSNSARAVLRSAGCQARHIASKQLQSQQRLIKPLRSRRYRGRVMYLNCHTVTAARRCTVWIRMPLVDSHSDAESGFAFRCRKWFRMEPPRNRPMAAVAIYARCTGTSSQFGAAPRNSYNTYALNCTGQVAEKLFVCAGRRSRSGRGRVGFAGGGVF